MEHGKVGHRGTLYMQSLRVPWLMAGPGAPEVVVDEPVGLADVMPTLLELLGVSAPPMRGESKRSLLRGERAPDLERLVFSQNDWGLRLYSAVVGDRQVIVDNIRGRYGSSIGARIPRSRSIAYAKRARRSGIALCGMLRATSF